MSTQPCSPFSARVPGVLWACTECFQEKASYRISDSGTTETAIGNGIGQWGQLALAFPLPRSSHEQKHWRPWVRRSARCAMPVTWSATTALMVALSAPCLVRARTRGGERAGRRLTRMPHGTGVCALSLQRLKGWGLLAYQGSGSRVSPVWARNPSMSSGRYWMRLSRFLTVAASWSTVPADRLPRPFFIWAHMPSTGLRSGA
jgi:hypothetical protein